MDEKRLDNDGRAGGRLSERRGVLFAVVALVDICFADGPVVVHAGEIGLAVLAWGGQAPGCFVEWEGGMSIGVFKEDEGRRWERLVGTARLN